MTNWSTTPSASHGDAEVSRRVAALSSAFDAAVDPAGLTVAQRRQLICELSAFANRVGVARAQLVADVDDQQGFGHAEPAGWLRDRTRSTRLDGERTVRVGRRLDDLPVARAAATAGDLGLAHLDEIRRAADAAPERFADGGESYLVARARTLDPASLRRTVTEWIAGIAPEVIDDEAAALHHLRSLSVSTESGQTMRISGQLAGVDAATVATALDVFADLERRADLDARDDAVRAGATPDDADSQMRTPTQQRADGLAAMARAALDHLRGGGASFTNRVRPVVEVVIDHADLLAHAGVAAAHRPTGPPVQLSPTEVQRLCCDARVARVISGGPSVTLDVGRAQRTVPRELRRVVERRDGGCRAPSCGRPASWCEAHHITHWKDGGETHQDNLVLLCSRHHHDVHAGRLNLSGTPIAGLVWSDQRGAHLPGWDPPPKSPRTPPAAGSPPGAPPRSRGETPSGAPAGSSPGSHHEPTAGAPPEPASSSARPSRLRVHHGIDDGRDLGVGWGA